MLKIKRYCKVRDHCYYAEEYGGTVSRRILKTVYLFRKKQWKILNLFSSNIKRSYNKW